MAEYIDRNAFGNSMYHEAFEKDSDMQKWDSGCWIRYKLFEKVLRDTPSADVVKVVRCKDCLHFKHSDIRPNYCEVWDWQNTDKDYCSFAERKTDG